MYYEGQRVILKNKNDGFKKMNIDLKPFNCRLKYMNENLRTLEGTHGIIQRIYKVNQKMTYYNVFVLEANMHFDLNEDCFVPY